MDSDLLTLDLGAVQYWQILLVHLKVLAAEVAQVVASVAQLLAFVACIYVIGAILCRMKGPSDEVAPLWLWIHRLMVVCSVLIMWCFVDGGLGLLASCTLSVIANAVALYIHASKNAWTNGIPQIARRKREPDETLYA